MKIKLPKIFFTALLFIIFGFCTTAKAQSITNLERQLSVAQKEFFYANTKLDSLKNALNERAEIIDRAKKNSTKNEDEILALMSTSVSITNEYRSQEQKVRVLEEKVDNLKTLLSGKYTHVIDSLKTLQAQGQSNNNVDKLILQYTEKKLLIAPQIASLSVSPERLAKLDASKSNDPVERKIIKEYLTTALNEVDSYLSQIDSENDEIAEITLLQKKTQQFLDETDFSNQIRPVTVVSQSTTSLDYLEGDPPANRFDAGSGVVNNQLVVPQLETYSKIMNQLSFMNSPVGSSSRATIETAKSQLSLNEYVQFLKELESRLKEYKLILQNKAADIDE